jgi:hypothetical protein
MPDRASFSEQQAGRITEAIKLGERVLADCRRILGPEHPFTLRATRSLSEAYRKAGTHM